MINQVCASGGLKCESIRGELNESRYRAGIPGSPGSSPQSGSAGEPSSTGPAPAAVLDSAKRLKTAKSLFQRGNGGPQIIPARRQRSGEDRIRRVREVKYLSAFLVR